MRPRSDGKSARSHFFSLQFIVRFFCSSFSSSLHFCAPLALFNTHKLRSRARLSTLNTHCASRHAAQKMTIETWTIERRVYALAHARARARRRRRRRRPVCMYTVQSARCSVGPADESESGRRREERERQFGGGGDEHKMFARRRWLQAN